MALPRFKIVNANSIDEAAELLKDTSKKQKVIGGGTDLLHGYKDDIYSEYPDVIINLRNGEEGYINEDQDGVHIGALTTIHDIEKDKLLNEEYTVLSQAAYTVASPQIRNASTLGGNICQEPRCWYFRNADNLFKCMRKGGDACPAFTGRNDLHSVCGAAKVSTTPCQEECPNNTPIPLYFDMIRKGDIETAVKVLMNCNPLMAMTGRVCPHTCQSMCNRNEFDSEVSIREIEREMGDYFLENASELLPECNPDTGKKVAVIGAGPAGLTAAYYLRLAGNDVTVFDMNEKAGGMLVYGIPAYRLPKDLVEKNVKIIADMGVKFKMGVKIGKDITLDSIRADHDAVLLGIGAWVSMPVGCKGEDADGVIGGIDFLAKIARKEDTGVKGKIVGVVGGGNTAMDAVRSAKRLGASKVYNFYRRTQAEMPADEIEIIEATEEGIEFKYLVSPKEIVVKDGHIDHVLLQKMELGEADASGRRRPVPIEGEYEAIALDILISAVGQGVDPAGMEDAGLTKKNWIKTDDKYATQLVGVFAAGDGAQGPETAIKAIANARKAAGVINEYLGVPCNEQTFESNGLLSFDKDAFKPSPKVELKNKPVAERTLYDEDVDSIGMRAAVKEACRCFDCGCIAACPSDTAPALVALDAEIKTTKRVIPAEDFFTVGVHTSTVLEPDELVKEIILPKPDGKRKSVYMKYRQRKAIDFPLLGVAVSLGFDGDVVKDARIVLGAAAPVPYRATLAEEYIVGKKLTDDVIEETARLVTDGMLPLAENGYKVTIAKAYVRRSLTACK